MKGMNAASEWRWERVLLLFAVLFAVVAMHAAVAPIAPVGAMPGMSSGTELSVAAPGSHTMAPATMEPVIATDAGQMGAGHMPGPMPMVHQMLHLCLAVLAAVIQLGLALGALLIMARRLRTPSGRSPRAIIVAPRPPPRSAVRLAQLCVLRN